MNESWTATMTTIHQLMVKVEERLHTDKINNYNVFHEEIGDNMDDLVPIIEYLVFLKNMDVLFFTPKLKSLLFYSMHLDSELEDMNLHEILRLLKQFQQIFGNQF
jgi:hypothetical protein